MDINILFFLSAISVVIFLTGIVIGAWVRLALGWIAGGLLIIIGMDIGAGGTITSTVVIDSTDIVTTALDIGISSENFMIIFILSGLTMLTVATFMDK